MDMMKIDNRKPRNRNTSDTKINYQLIINENKSNDRFKINSKENRTETRPRLRQDKTEESR